MSRRAALPCPDRHVSPFRTLHHPGLLQLVGSDSSFHLAQTALDISAEAVRVHHICSGESIAGERAKSSSSFDSPLGLQDPEHGGIADRPDNVADVFHTFFGVAGLSLLGYRLGEDSGVQDEEAQGSSDVAPTSSKGSLLQEIDPVYALPAKVTKKLGLQLDYQALGR